MLRSLTVFFWLCAFSLLCGACRASEENKQELIFYDSIVGIESVLSIRRSAGEYNVALHDLVIAAEASVGIGDRSTYLIVDDISIVFVIPGDFGDNVRQWTYEDCRYDVLERRTYFDSDGEPVNEANIEQTCESNNYVVRYMYSESHGLRSIAIGNYQEGEDGALDFMARNGLMLRTNMKGFGARQR